MDNNLRFRGCRAEMLKNNMIRSAASLLFLIGSVLGFVVLLYVSSGAAFVHKIVVAILAIVFAFFLSVNVAALISPKRCSSYKYVLEQLEIDATSHASDRAV